MNTDNSTRPYPDHLYNPLRREIAMSLLEKELSKGDASSSEDNLSHASWPEHLDEHLFWNGVEGFMGGVLLKPIVHFLTAENYMWSKRELRVEDIQLSSKLSQLDRIQGLEPDTLLLADIMSRLQNDPAELAAQRKTIETYRRSEKQNDYPVLVVEKNGRPMVMDGNRRSLDAALFGQETISTWYCETRDELPKNFWYPVDDMMRLLRIYNGAKDSDPTLKVHIKSVLDALFAQTSVAKKAFEIRIAAMGTEGAKDFI